LSWACAIEELLALHAKWSSRGYVVSTPPEGNDVVVKSFLITGASTGIGEACALRLDQLGHRVYAGVRSEAHAQGLRERGSERIVPVFLDVTDQAQVDAVAERIADGGGSLDGVVNNAGIGRGGPLEYLPLDAWREQLEVNVLGPIAVTKAVLPFIRAAPGRIVFIGSIGGRVATMLMGPYNASKFAIEAIGESLRSELHPWGISVSVVEPGAVKTPIWDKAREQADHLERALPEEGRTRYARHVTAIRKAIEMQDRQGVSPDKVAAAVEHALFSPRPKTRYVVGTDAHVQALLVRCLPDRPREAIIRRLAGP
jgi:NAD(P)-dependent dehydrogenase (short-subunit alcohol dehydrogenase family)